MQWSTEWGFNDRHLNSLTDSGNRSWPTSLEDSLADHVHGEGSLLFCFKQQDWPPFSLPQSYFTSQDTPGEGNQPCQGQPACLCASSRAGTRHGFGSSVELGDNHHAGQGKPCQLQLWNCWDHHKTKIPDASKVAVHHKHSLLSSLIFVISVIPCFWLCLTTFTTCYP